MSSQHWPVPTVRNTSPAIAVNALLTAALDALDGGVMVCDAHCSLLAQNQAARWELTDGGVLRLSTEGILDIASGPSLQALRRAVHGAALHRSHHLVPLRQGAQMLMISVQPLRVDEAAEQWVLVLTGRRGVCPDLAVQHLARLYDLTPTELSVLSSLLAGVRIADLARARSIKLSTARSHVASLRAKMGVQRLDDITRLVAELPPMRGALTRYEPVSIPPCHPEARPAITGFRSSQPVLV
ncbi:helix-turn-helix transcriptional regulator [Roseateles sp. P5_E8]